MKNPLNHPFPASCKAWSSLNPKQPRIRLSWLFLFVVLAFASLANAQVIGMRDIFTYSTGTSSINGHVPTTGTGTWTGAGSSGSNGASVITSTGSCAQISTNGGVIGTGWVTACWPFTPAANTIYTISAAFNLAPTGSGSNSYCSFGFSNSTGGGNKSTNPGPWQNIYLQKLSTDNKVTQSFYGTTLVTSGTIPAAYYSGTSPLLVTVTWNTSTGLANYYINNVLYATGTTPLPVTGGTSTFYGFFQGTTVGNYAKVSNITLSAQPVTFGALEMQDNFTTSGTDINNQTPSTVMGSGWSANWATNNSNATISTSGSQAVIVTNGGNIGSGNAIANFPFMVCPNTFYTLRTAVNFNGPVGTGLGNLLSACIGFSNQNGGGNIVGNPAPWAFVNAQGVGTDTPAAVLMTGTTIIGSTNLPASAYSAPIALTVTWDTSTGVTKFYANDLLQATGTTVLPSNGQYYAYFQGWQSGSAVNVNTISLTSQPLPLPEVWYGPDYQADFLPYFSSIFETGTTACGWPTARDHTQVLDVGPHFWDSTNHNITTAQMTQLMAYLKAHNMKMGLTTWALSGTAGTCSWGEGFDDPTTHAIRITNIQNAISAAGGGSLDYIAVDESLLHHYTPSGQLGGTCTYLVPLDTIISQVSSVFTQYKNAFPGVKLVLFEGITNRPTADVSYFLAQLNAAGTPVDTVIVDFNGLLCYPAQLITSASTCAAQGVRMGEFFDGFPTADGADGNAAQFALGMKITLQSYLAANIPVPAKFCVATWGIPGVCTVPETSGTNLSALMNLDLTSPYILQTPPSALYRLYNTSSVPVYTSSYATYLNWISLGYTSLKVYGGIATTPNAMIGGIPGLVPLYLYFNSSNSWYALSLSSSDSALIANGYANQSTLGYALPVNNGYALGGVPLYAFYKSVLNRYLYSMSPTVPGGYVLSGTTAYMLPGYMHNGVGQ